jgi:hypothetical protein
MWAEEQYCEKHNDEIDIKIQQWNQGQAKTKENMLRNETMKNTMMK